MSPSHDGYIITMQTISISDLAISEKLTQLDLLFKNLTVGEETFPEEAFGHLRSLGLLLLNVPERHGGLGIGTREDSVTLYKMLNRIGFHDLSVGRIYEGHINAMQLIDQFGGEIQKRKYFKDCRDGLLFGTWNSELPNEPLRLLRSDHGYVLKGAKIFCSGGTNVPRPIVTASTPEGKHMIVLDLEGQNLEEDTTYWRPIGMKASVSYRLDFSGMEVDQDQILGRVGDYEREPHFSGGAGRFAAVQLGGAEAAIYHTLQHLTGLNRTECPYQIARLGRLAILRERGRAWLNLAGRASDNSATAPMEFIHCANMFRLEARNICEEVLRLAELSVGLQGLMAPHPLERIHRDLSVYLKQPGPDRALKEVGKHFIHAADE